MTTYGPCYKIKAALDFRVGVHLLFRFLLGETLSFVAFFLAMKIVTSAEFILL